MTDVRRTVDDHRITVYKYDTDRFKSENLSIYFSLPTRRERSVARSLLLAVLKRGTEKYPSQKHINERLDELYATLVDLKNHKFDDAQLLGVSADVIYSSYTDSGDDLLPDALDVASQLLFHPARDEGTGELLGEYLESEKENYKSIILSQINEPRTYAAIRCREEMFYSLGIIDKLDTMCQKIDAVTIEDIRECYREMLEEAKMLVFYVGKRSDEDLEEKIFGILSDKQIDERVQNNKNIKMLEPVLEPKIIIEESELSQSRLVIGFDCRATWRDEDYYAMLLCNEIFGASPTSKLMMNVRERLSLCYECSSVYNSARGAIFATIGIDKENYELAKNAILSELEDIKRGNVTNAELDAAKKSIYNVYSSLCDSPDAIERFYLGRLINGVDVDIAEFLDKINSLTLEDVMNAASKITPHTLFFLCGNGDGEEDELYE